MSAALRLPNTRELLMRVHQLATRQAFWGQTSFRSEREAQRQFQNPPELLDSCRTREQLTACGVFEKLESGRFFVAQKVANFDNSHWEAHTGSLFLFG
jgi:hypothetical protein